MMNGGNNNVPHRLLRQGVLRLASLLVVSLERHSAESPHFRVDSPQMASNPNRARYSALVALS